MTNPHAVVWLDHREARIIDYSLDDVHQVKVRHDGASKQVHHRAGSVGSGHAKDDHHYFDQIVAALGNAQEILIVGPASTKGSFHKDLEARHRDVAKRVVGVEPLDHPSVGELLAYAKKYFKRVDGML